LFTNPTLVSSVPIHFPVDQVVFYNRY